MSKLSKPMLEVKPGGAYSVTMITQFLKILATILIVVDPAGMVPLFLSLTGEMEGRKRRSVLWTAILVAFLVLSLFILAGRFILEFLGIGPGAFYVSGGILLLLTSVDMLYGKAKRNSGGEAREVASAEDEGNVAVFPLAIPMLAGPGELLRKGAKAVIVTLGIAALAMGASPLILRAVGKKGVIVLERIMGLLLAGLSVQFVYEGLVRLGFPFRQ